MSCWVFEPGKPPVEYTDIVPIASRFETGTYMVENYEWSTIINIVVNGNLNGKSWLEMDISYIPKHIRAAALILE